MLWQHQGESQRSSVVTWAGCDKFHPFDCALCVPGPPPPPSPLKPQLQPKPPKKGGNSSYHMYGGRGGHVSSVPVILTALALSAAFP